MSRARRGRLGLSSADIFGGPAAVTPPAKKDAKKRAPTPKAAAAPKPKAKAAPRPSLAEPPPAAVIAIAAPITPADKPEPDSQVWRAGYLLGLTLGKVLGALRRLRGWPRRRKG